jgi:trans-aconitate 2-methyltransferase
MKAHAAVDMASPSTAQERRTVAALDLLRRLPDIAPRRIGNLRGGPEAVEDLLARRFPSAEIAPIEFAHDPSGDTSSSLDRYRFRLSYGASSRPNEPFDLIFSNGTLEMLPSLRQLAPELLSLTKPGGVLAFQLPHNLREPNRQLLRMVAADGPWARQLIPVAKSRPFNPTIEELDALLRPLCGSIEYWQTTYFHWMNGAAEIIETMRETSLAPFLQPLGDEMRRRFLVRYADELTQAYPARPDGKVLLRFPRIFFLARR